MNQELNHKPNSIEVSKNAKDEYSWKIKLYFDRKLLGGLAVNECIERLNKDLKKRFPAKGVPK